MFGGLGVTLLCGAQRERKEAHGSVGGGFLMPYA